MSERFINYPQQSNLEMQTNLEHLARPIGTYLIVHGNILRLYDYYLENGKVVEIWRHIIPSFADPFFEET